MYNTNWETRVAAGQAVEAVLKQVPVWRKENIKSEDGESRQSETEVSKKLTLEAFDIRKLLETGEFLTGSEGKEFDVEKEAEGRISVQREQLNKQFGFDKLGLKSEQFIDDEDLKESVVSSVETKKSASEILSDEIKSVTGEERSHLSAREINRLKRKAKQDAKASRKADEDAENEPKKMRVVEADSLLSEDMERETSDLVLASLYDQLLSDLLSPGWERRHGAALGLRELVKGHGQGEDHQWLEDLLVRLLTVMAMDRFGDFVGDSVVCPVRESVGQVIGVVVTSLRSETVLRISSVLAVMMESEEWHTRHAAMLTTKYLVSVRSDLGSSLLSSLYPSLVQGLTDTNDDVVSVAASSLLPACPLLTSHLSRELDTLVGILWDHTTHCDDITSSTHSIMALLAELLSQPEGARACAGTGLSSLVPRLYPFLAHNSSQVRRATLSCLLTLSSSPGSEGWLAACCQETMSHLYTRALLEHHQPNLSLLLSVWSQVCHNTPLQPLLLATCPLFSHWLHLISSPPQAPLQLDQLKTVQYLGGPEAQPITDPLEKQRAVWRARDTAARMLGKLSSFIVEPMPDIIYTDVMETPLEMFLGKVLIPQLTTGSAYHKLGVGLLVLHWLDQAPPPPLLAASSLPAVLLTALATKQTYSELSSQLNRLRSEAGDYISSLKYFKMEVDISPSSLSSLDCEAVQHLVGPLTEHLLSQTKLKPKMLETVEQRRSSVMATLEVTREELTNLDLLVLSILAGAAAYIGPEALPDKLNPVIKPLMESIKKQSNEAIQKTAARSLVRVINSCVSRHSSPTEKVVKNLCAFVCSNPETTPLVNMAHVQGQVGPTDGILTLHYNERNAEKITSKAKKGKKAVTASKISHTSAAPLQATTDIDNEEDVKKVEIQRRGAKLALLELAIYFGEDLPEKMPKVWDICYRSVLGESQDGVEGDWQYLVNSLSVLSVLTPVLHPDLHSHLLHLLPSLHQLTGHSLTAVRYMAAITLTQLALKLTVEVMSGVVEELVPRLEASSSLAVRQGVMETLFCVTDQLGLAVVPYIVLLVVPVLGAMSDTDSKVRLLATSTFASLVRLMPLEGGVPEPESLSQHLRERKEDEKEFLSQLLDSKTARDFTVSVPVNAELRSYQVAGINWLAFLNKYRLHGILCDDMGLGKTLQTICMLASHHQNMSEKGHTVQSLVVCPTTLGGHWLEEITKFVSKQYLNPFLYFGQPSQRASLRSQIAHHNVIITSYEIVRSDVDFLGSIKWNYLVLDEGHVIKNTKTKTSIAVRQLVAAHRVILTGTPIQNGVNELWSLFDFLMPGYLGTEKQFTAKYSRPILNSRDAKSSGKEQEAGALAMESLHRQTLPFILRRVKEDVLSDLPPKITQDYYCDLSPVQTDLYEDFARSQSQAGQAGEEGTNTSPTHVFQALQYLKKVCNHPRLVLTKDHPSYSNILTNHLGGNVDNLVQIEHAAKLTALKQLLVDLGIAGSEDTERPVVGQHRALIFCQLKTMLDILETDLLAPHLPSVSYLRLDGSVPATSRHSLVSKFNKDPSIDLLLLSTSVGGLGLNLTGADTVIFVEHDWNPMKDLQAMDRAHRIGQKKVVNVYRLITRNTLEEKIMSLQQFKIHTARTVISSDNTSIASMQTDQVMEVIIIITIH